MYIMKIFSLSVLLLVSYTQLFGGNLGHAAKFEDGLDTEALITRLPITKCTPTLNHQLKRFFEVKPKGQWILYIEAVETVQEADHIEAQTYYDILLLIEYFENPTIAKQRFKETFPVMTMRTKYTPFDLALAMRLDFVGGRFISR